LAGLDPAVAAPKQLHELRSATCFSAAFEDPISEYFPDHHSASRTLGHVMEFAPQTPSTNQEPFIGRNVRPRNAEDTVFSPAVPARVDELGSSRESGFDQAQFRSHPFFDLG
jgi:hypothetical protein